MTTGPEQDIDPYDNTESRAVQADQSSYVGRAAGNGGAPAGVELSDEDEQATGGGTAGGDPVAGVTIDDADREAAVPGDTGPEHHGQR